MADQSVIMGVGKDIPVKIHQWANDWVSVSRLDNGRTKIVRPTNLRLSKKDIERFKHERTLSASGYFWSEWTMNDDGTFRKQC